MNSKGMKSKIANGMKIKIKVVYLFIEFFSDGQKQLLDANKIERRLNNLSYGLNMNFVNPVIKHKISNENISTKLIDIGFKRLR